MEIPAFLKGESLARLFQGFVAGGVLTALIGFHWGGWMLTSTAEKLADQKVEKAVVAAMAPVCADKFRALADYNARVAKLQKEESWNRRDDFPKTLVTLPGDDDVSGALVDACSKLVLTQSAELKSKDKAVQ
jgi:hypothetical protein